MPRVSVIVPNYNHANFLEKRLDSILNQTYQDFELIILDDKSNDRSKDVIEKYRLHPKISQIVYNEVNSGTTFKQWNKGFRLAKGELVWIAESDDAATETFLSKLVAKFDKNPNIGIAYANSYLLDEHDEVKGVQHHWKNSTFNTNRWSQDYCNEGIDEINRYLFFFTVIENVSCALIKKKIAFSVGLADESLRYTGDANLYMKILLCSDLCYISEPLNYFRDHSTNTSKKAFVNGFRPLEEILAHAKILSNTQKITPEAKATRLKQAVSDYQRFAGITLKENKSLINFLKGNNRLLSTNPLYFFKVLKGYLSQKIGL